MNCFVNVWEIFTYLIIYHFINVRVTLKIFTKEKKYIANHRMPTWKHALSLFYCIGHVKFSANFLIIYIFSKIPPTIKSKRSGFQKLCHKKETFKHSGIYDVDTMYFYIKIQMSKHNVKIVPYISE